MDEKEYNEREVTIFCASHLRQAKTIEVYEKRILLRLDL